MRLEIGKKFSERQIDTFIDTIYKNFRKYPDDSYTFDLTRTEWMSNQGLLLFTGLLKYFIERKTTFEVVFVKRGTPLDEIPKRVALHIIQIWETWGIWKIIPNKQDLDKYLGITFESIDFFKKRYNINFTRPEIYDGFGITPFVCLDYITNPDDEKTLAELKDFHTLNNATIQIVTEHNCQHPFVNGLLGEVISKEIYDNFLYHHNKSFFNTENEYAFLSLTLKGRIDERETDIQKILSENFKAEEIPQAIDFFFDSDKQEYKNNSYISYSFIDFGEGIADSLREEYVKTHPGKENITDSDILEYAFRYDTSKNPITNIFEKQELKDFIPRGLFDVITVVQRYHGVIIVRSNKGKILYDFSNNKSVEDAYVDFSDNKTYFPGTFYTIYLPPVGNFETSIIRPSHVVPQYEGKQHKYNSIYEILLKAKKQSRKKINEVLYDELYGQLKESTKKIIFYSFENITDISILRKVIFFFITNYEVNTTNNVVIIHPPSIAQLDLINSQIQSLSQINKQYRIAPLPFIYRDSKDNSIYVYWLGIYDEQDRKKLSDLLYDQFSLTKGDFNDPSKIIGHLNYFDGYGNLLSEFPKDNEINQAYSILDYKARLVMLNDTGISYDRAQYNSYIAELEDIIFNRCIVEKPDSIFFCLGNYYQHKYIELFHLFEDARYRDNIAKLLFSHLVEQLDMDALANRKYKFIAITSSSIKILASLEKQKYISKDDIITIDNYHKVNELYEKILGLDAEYSYILVSDIIATGNVVKRCINLISQHKQKLACVAALIRTTKTETFENDKDLKGKIISLFEYTIAKFDREEIREDLLQKEILRISPFTNTPIYLNPSKTDNVILSNDEFLEIIDDKHVFAGLMEFNNVIHPYYFDTANIIEDVGSILLEKILNKKNDQGEKIFKVEAQNLKIFYPKKCDIEHVHFDEVKGILKDQSLEVYELERYSTKNGWTFPHITFQYEKIIKDNPVLILDDGSCTGDSLIQMINEVSYFKPKKITVLCLIGRVVEHRREFMSLIKTINHNNSNIELDIYFGTHWNIHTFYMDENPHTKERLWLKQVIDQSYTPSGIQKIAKQIYPLLKQVAKDKFVDYKYFPREKHYIDKHPIPKREIIRVRNEIGKVTQMRFVKEDFKYFDEFIKKYESSKPSESRYKEVELICACISYESYLFESIMEVAPDAGDKLREFIDAVIFGNPKRKNRKLHIDKLTYHWDPRDFIHLFFAMYEETTLIDKLRKGNLELLLGFIDEYGISANYLFYKLLKFFPLDKDAVKTKNGEPIKIILKTLSQKARISPEYKTQLKIFRSFLSTLPVNRTFESQLIDISDSMEKLTDEKRHKDSITAQIGYMITDTLVMFNHYNSVNKDRYLENWRNISGFINPILSFAKAFNSFFSNDASKEVEELTEVTGSLNELLLPLPNQSNVSESTVLQIQDKLTYLQNFFIPAKMTYQLLSRPFLRLGEITEYLDQRIKEETSYEIGLDTKISDSVRLLFPYYYFREIIMESIFNNFRHANHEKRNINITIDESTKGDNYIDITIVNQLIEKTESGNGSGTKLLSHANKFPEDIFFYKKHIDNNLYIQTISIKKC